MKDRNRGFSHLCRKGTHKVPVNRDALNKIREHCIFPDWLVSSIVVYQVYELYARGHFGIPLWNATAGVRRDRRSHLTQGVVRIDGVYPSIAPRPAPVTAGPRLCCCVRIKKVSIVDSAGAVKSPIPRRRG